MMEQLLEMSRRYGADADYVLAGGGNTSWKAGGKMWVKASGTALGGITEGGFVAMDCPALLEMLSRRYPKEDDAREAAALADMMAARLPDGEPTAGAKRPRPAARSDSGAPLPGHPSPAAGGSCSASHRSAEPTAGAKRPSVEALLHAMFPQAFVLHLHPALVNGLTCGKTGEADCAAIFGGAALWVPLTKPGYVLAKVCYDSFTAYEKEHGAPPNIVFMQNHGVVVAADSVEEVDALMARVMEALRTRVTQEPDLAPLEAPEAAEALAPVLRMLYRQAMGEGMAAFSASAEVLAFAQSEAAMAPLMLPFIPDQIVYCKGSPLYLQPGPEGWDAAAVAASFAAFAQKHGTPPKIVIARDVGMFALGKTKKEADIAALLFDDAIKIAVYSRAFGGPLNLTEDFTNFILGWEIENYRQKVALAAGPASRMAGKICLVTGGAQGFGAGIARALAAEGGSLVLADMNEAGAKALAAGLNAEHGPGRALAVAANVADEASVQEMVRRTVLAYGGLDLLVSCAGILTAGSLSEMTLEQFQRVTAVNYTGYFLCAKYGSVPMKRQRAAAPGYTMDIVEVNSKSGLEGSKANFAYAGSKFGGIGLTQSFALELAEYGIKVNAVCPGNLLDGPLWSDPERGLFVQYLRAGKVPGAKTVEDVRAFYEAKVPMGRGCTEEDAARAILYLVEQQYETGQALPVTGGQVMLN